MAEDKRSKQHIVLVHGACHGAWCWYKVSTMLKSAGYRVSVPDLGASGIDGRRIEDVATFSDYSQPLLEILASLPPEEKVVLVGHSLGGLSIALAADKFPEKVAALVFVAAFMPDCTSSPASVYKPLLELPQSFWMDTEFCPLRSHDEKPPLTSIFFGPQFTASKLYQLCSPEDLTLAATLARPSSLFVEDLKSKPAFSKDRYGSVSRFYVVCNEDAAIVKDHQQLMIENYPGSRVVEIEGADHMVMFSKPQELFQSLLHITEDM